MRSFEDFMKLTLGKECADEEWIGALNERILCAARQINDCIFPMRHGDLPFVYMALLKCAEMVGDMMPKKQRLAYKLFADRIGMESVRVDVPGKRDEGN